MRTLIRTLKNESQGLINKTKVCNFNEQKKKVIRYHLHALSDEH